MKAYIYQNILCPECDWPMEKVDDWYDKKLIKCINPSCDLLNKVFHQPQVELVEVCKEVQKIYMEQIK